ncbi:tryptophan--tRNA ligase [Candidatus Levibacter sp. Uisw_134_01]|uniref:tryptophan--tRNA ligase n=1 Tax=Candidatus Levibacter sp. Uisw_134_01 TaxID=3230999 RepID=UPI003D3F9E31
MTIPQSKQNEKRIFSGIQPTGNLHLGNYLGAIKNWVKLQEDFSSIFSIVDLHAITVPQEPLQLRASIHEVTAAIIASGIDINKSILFNQSSVKEHSELAWIFNCVCRIGWLNRMTQFKEKAGKNRENATVGLYSYPVLMAADILLYKATHVPVGDDQKQHIELARDIASSFNNMFTLDNENNFFSLPEPQIFGPATRVMSLRDGTKKMSKSDPSDASRINLTDTKEEISSKIKKAKTDPNPLPETVDELKKRPEAFNLLNIYSSLSNQTLDKTVENFVGKGFSHFKPKLIELAVENLNPISSEMRYLLKDTKAIDKILKTGEIKARQIAEPVLQDVKSLVGLIN